MDFTNGKKADDILPIFTPYGLIPGVTGAGVELDDPLRRSIFGPELPMESYKPKENSRIEDTTARQLHPFLFLRVKKGVFRCYDETLWQIVLNLEGTIYLSDRANCPQEEYSTILRRLTRQVYGTPNIEVDILLARHGKNPYAIWTFDFLKIRLLFDVLSERVTLEFENIPMSKQIAKDNGPIPDIYTYFAPETPEQIEEYEEFFGPEMSYEEYFGQDHEEEEFENENQEEEQGIMSPADIKSVTAMAEFGDAQCQFTLGDLYESGRGVTRDLEKARHWYSLAAEQNDLDALIALAFLLENGPMAMIDYEKAIDCYSRAAEAGEPVAIKRLFDIYKEGQIGQPVDWKKANHYKSLLQKGREKGLDED